MDITRDQRMAAFAKTLDIEEAIQRLASEFGCNLAHKVMERRLHLLTAVHAPASEIDDFRDDCIKSIEIALNYALDDIRRVMKDTISREALVYANRMTDK